MKLQTINNKLILVNNKALKGGEDLVVTVTGDGTNALTLPDFADGVYHGKKTDAPTSQNDVMGFYLIRSGQALAFITRNSSGAYRNYINSAGKITTNVSTQLFNGTYEIYKVSNPVY